jgi:hypothetical protein
MILFFLQTGTHEQEGYYDINVFIDTILRVVFEHHGGRRIVFSTFDPDTCVAYVFIYIYFISMFDQSD